MVEVEALKELISPPAHILLLQVHQAAEHTQVLTPGEDLVHGRELPGESDPLADLVCTLDDIVTEDLGMTLVRAEKRRQNSNDSRLARPVGAEKTLNGPLLDLQVDAIDSDNLAKALDQARDPDRGRCAAVRAQSEPVSEVGDGALFSVLLARPRRLSTEES